MKLKKLIKYFVKNKIEFSIGWDPTGLRYGICVTIGNFSYFAEENDTAMLAEIYKEVNDWFAAM